MAADPRLVTLIERCMVVQNRLFKGLAIMCGVTGLALLVILALSPAPGPRDVVGHRVGLVMALMFTAGAPWCWVYVDRRMARIRTLLFDNPLQVTKTQVVEIRQGNASMMWGLRFWDARNKMLGVNVRSQSEANTIVALINEARARAEAART